MQAECTGYGTACGAKSKRSFFDELRNKGIYAESGRVNGMTLKNIIKGYELSGSF
ncbi:MAG: hypothetical protein J6P40_12510 [Oscillospiraceae bacterium]|nr:hypothetical protein [Oscillospiraceae bacterium]MBO6094415.1 hypothetical protein [Oscillospiraceae bacterium]